VKCYYDRSKESKFLFSIDKLIDSNVLLGNIWSDTVSRAPLGLTEIVW